MWHNVFMHRRASKTDVAQNALRVVEEATGAPLVMPKPIKFPKKKNLAAIALGKLGARKGGRARAARLSPEKRKEIAQRAAQARWAREKS